MKNRGARRKKGESRRTTEKAWLRSEYEYLRPGFQPKEGGIGRKIGRRDYQEGEGRFLGAVAGKKKKNGWGGIRRLREGQKKRGRKGKRNKKRGGGKGEGAPLRMKRGGGKASPLLAKRARG